MRFQDALVFAAVTGVPLMLSGCGETIEKYVSPQAIDGFVKIGDDMRKTLTEGCEEDVTMEKMTTNMWWPGCGFVKEMDDFGSCEGCVNTALAKEMDEFNKKYGGKRVSYNSRAGKDADGKDIEVIKLGGWWLPAPNADEKTPRIVVQHGFRANSNKFRVQYAAFQLRKLGFSVLLNNLRDHCYSEESSAGLIGWGHAYPLDLLGAVDFARDHADKPIDPSKVGILGFSMGGFTTANAFGMADDVPAAWIDGAPFTPKAGFEEAFQGALPHASLGALLTDSVWEDIEEHAAKDGVDINGHLPEKLLPKGPDTKRPVFVTANKGDATVPFSSSESLVEVLKKYPEKYDLIEFWQHDGECSTGEAHCVDHVNKPAEYEAKLCKFWSSVFGTDATCGQSEETASKEKLYENNGAISQHPLSHFGPIAASLLGMAGVGLGVVVIRQLRSSVQREVVLLPEAELSQGGSVE